MQLHLQGSSHFELDPETAYKRLTDLDIMTRALKDAEDVTILDNETAEATIKLRIALVSTRLRMRVRISGKRPPSHAELTAEGSGSGSHIKIASIFDLEREGDHRTNMTWSAKAEITGIMAGIGSLLLKGFAEKRVGEMFDGIHVAIEKQRE